MKSRIGSGDEEGKWEEQDEVGIRGKGGGGGLFVRQARLKC